MARSRNIKPAFFKNEALAEVGCDTRLLFIGLWTLADREGRAEDRPKRIRAEIFPFDGFDVESMLTELQRLGFLTRYEVDGNKYIQITNFVKHQDPHYREKASEIPPMCGSSNEIIATGVTRTQRARILERDNFKCQHCGSLEHPCIDHVLPVSRGGDSSDDNLQVLCLPCNTKKGNKLDSSSSQRRVDVKSSDSPSVPLIPDSLNLIPDSLNTDSLSSDACASVVASKADNLQSQHPAKPDCPHKEIVALYHEKLPSCPAIRDWTAARATALRARWNESSERQNLEYWRGLFEYIAGIPFLTGSKSGSNGRAFFASLDWIVKPENFAKIREGRYEERAA